MAWGQWPAFDRNAWPTSVEISGRLASVSVAAFIGISGRFASDYGYQPAKLAQKDRDARWRDQAAVLAAGTGQPIPARRTLESAEDERGQRAPCLTVANADIAALIRDL